MSRLEQIVKAHHHEGSEKAYKYYLCLLRYHSSSDALVIAFEKYQNAKETSVEHRLKKLGR